MRLHIAYIFQKDIALFDKPTWLTIDNVADLSEWWNIALHDRIHICHLLIDIEASDTLSHVEMTLQNIFLSNIPSIETLYFPFLNVEGQSIDVYWPIMHRVFGESNIYIKKIIRDSYYNHTDNARVER